MFRYIKSNSSMFLRSSAAPASDEACQKKKGSARKSGFAAEIHFATDAIWQFPITRTRIVDLRDASSVGGTDSIGWSSGCSIGVDHGQTVIVSSFPFRVCLQPQSHTPRRTTSKAAIRPRGDNDRGFTQGVDDLARQSRRWI